MNLGTDFIPLTKINSQWIIGLNVRCKMIKLLGENRRNYRWLWVGDDILDITPKMKEYIYILNAIKIKNFCSAKDREMRVQKDIPISGRKSLWSTCLINDWYTNMQRTLKLNKKSNNPSKSRHNIWTDTSLKKT